VRIIRVCIKGGGDEMVTVTVQRIACHDFPSPLFVSKINMSIKI